MNLRGISCAKCEKPLCLPFVGTAFTDDGKEMKFKDSLPDGIVDGRGAVVVYLHRICKRAGRYSAKILGRNGKQSYVRHKAPQFHRDKLTVAEELRASGYSVSARGHRFLMVLPNMLSREVKKL